MNLIERNAGIFQKYVFEVWHVLRNRYLCNATLVASAFEIGS